MSRRWGPPPDRRPPWWPEDRAWPPQRRWGRRGPPAFIWRLGCLLLTAVFLLSVGTSVAVGFLAGRFGALPVATFVAVVLLLVVYGTGRGMRRFTRPMDDLIDAAGRIERGDYSARIPESGPRELRSVARAFNSMSARLKSSDEQRRSFLADVVHELRTPLAVIRGQAEGIADGVYAGDAEHIAPIVDATRSLELLVEDLRALALSDTGSLALNREPVDPVELVDETFASFKAQADEAGVTLNASTAPGLPQLDVDPTRMRSAIDNLVANALRHTPRSGSVTVSAVRVGGDRLVIAVTDNGEGIAPELLPHVFERFVRGAGSKGSGLGLAIAHDIVVAHGGTIDVESTVGAGTTFRISLPVATS
ncbi:MAG TPA: HAMP domain-containing sensor histidine kinase [Candidatus Dormibacteraeota bacterium]|nr:HAMP domain-containing sensor histidine kinase [Candidatus Dormibacteraeota bacterium]